MNWTGGKRSKIQANREKILQKQYFDRLRRRNINEGGINRAPLASRCLRYNRDHKHQGQPPPIGSDDLDHDVSCQLSFGPRFQPPLKAPKCSADYKTARQTCIDMLQSSFDWIGEAYTLRAPTESANSASQRIGNTEPDEFISSESDEETTESLIQEFKADECEQDIKKYDSLNERERGNDGQGEGDDESEGDEDEEEETLQVPERHIAICQAVRVLRRSSISNHTSVDYKSLLGEGQVTSDGPSSPPEIGNPSSEPAAICNGALSLSSNTEPNAAQAIVADNLEHQQEDGLSPLISTATSEFGQSPSSPEWPPANQEAAKRLQLSSGASKEEYFIELLGHGQTETEGISAIAPWSIQFSPIILSTDPEDTSILEPLDALNEAGQVYDTTIQVNGWGSDCSLPEMIRSEDWQGFDDSEVLSLK